MFGSYREFDDFKGAAAAPTNLASAAAGEKSQ
jgi:hypothetical protein